MQCLHCGRQNPTDAKFCMECGTLLVKGCPQCGATLPEDAKFCIACGAQVGGTSEEAPTAPSRQTDQPIDTPREIQGVSDPFPSSVLLASEGERRQLTVLFCDLVGSTALAEQLDPEEFRTVLRDYQATCAAVIRRFEGHLARYVGDGLLVYFGYPQAHEDDARRAVSTGLGIVEAIRGLNTRLQKEKRLELAVRVGIHTGLVVAGDMDRAAQLEAMAVVGETPNIAARLQGLAEPDTVVISVATHRLRGSSTARIWVCTRSRVSPSRWRCIGCSTRAPPGVVWRRRSGRA